MFFTMPASQNDYSPSAFLRCLSINNPLTFVDQRRYKVLNFKEPSKGSVQLPSYKALAISLALITVLAPVATDMYLASMPDIAIQFDVSYTQVQLTLTVFLFAMGAGQLLFGPIIDNFGRRRPLLIGLLTFTTASLLAAGAKTIDALILFRFIQGMTGALLLVIGFSTVRDVAQGTQAAGLFAILMTVEGLAPILAPIAGGYIDAHWGWRMIMLVLALIGIAIFINSFFMIPETLKKEDRLSLQPKIIFYTYWQITSDKGFLLPVLALSSVFFFLFAYISGSAYLYQTIYSLTPDVFGLVFGMSGIAVMLGAISSGQLVKRGAMSRVPLYGVCLIIIGIIISFFSVNSEIGLTGIILGFSISLFGLGLTEPVLMAIVMNSQKSAIGFTAALMGSFHLTLSALSTPISGWLLPMSINSWFIFLMTASIVSLLLVIFMSKN